MAGIRLLDRMLGRISGVETAHIPEVLPPEPSGSCGTPSHAGDEKNWRRYKHDLSHPVFYLSPNDPWTIADYYREVSNFCICSAFGAFPIFASVGVM